MSVHSVSSIRTSNAFRTLLIMVMLLAWSAFSQRCALGQILNARQAAAVQHACCKQEGQIPLKNEPMGKGAECCQALSVVVPCEANLTPGPPSESSCILQELLGCVLLSPRAKVSPEFVDSGPPRGLRTFVELVLHRSLRSHAPPLLS